MLIIVSELNHSNIEIEDSYHHRWLSIFTKDLQTAWRRRPGIEEGTFRLILAVIVLVLYLINTSNNSGWKDL